MNIQLGISGYRKFAPDYFFITFFLKDFIGGRSKAISSFVKLKHITQLVLYPWFMCVYERVCLCVRVCVRLLYNRILYKHQMLNEYFR